MDGVVRDHAPVVVTRQRGEDVVIVSRADWEGLDETLHLLSSPVNAARLLAAIAEADAGGGTAHELIDP